MQCLLEIIAFLFIMTNSNILVDVKIGTQKADEIKLPVPSATVCEACRISLIHNITSHPLQAKCILLFYKILRSVFDQQRI